MILNFFKILQFLILNIFTQKLKDMFANIIKFYLLVHKECINLIPKFQEGTTTQTDKKTIQSWKKWVPEFGIFGHPRLFGYATAKRL